MQLISVALLAACLAIVAGKEQEVKRWLMPAECAALPVALDAGKDQQFQLLGKGAQDDVRCVRANALLLGYFRCKIMHT